MSEEFNQGQVSLWHEGNFKTLRLHKAQEIINFASILPFNQLSFLGSLKYGYLLWFDGVNILFGEGGAKYSEIEVEKAQGLRQEIEDFIDNKKIVTEFKSSRQKGIMVNQDNWKELKKKIRKYEEYIKTCNDTHGLSTGNRDDDEGL